jgi:protein TonB
MLRAWWYTRSWWRKTARFQFQYNHRADPLLNKEALRILQAMPPWRPARHKGEIVRAETYVPMYFKLNKNAAPHHGQRTAALGTKIYAKTDRDILENSEIYTIVDKMPRYAYVKREWPSLSHTTCDTP